MKKTRYLFNNFLDDDTPWAAPVFVDFTSTLANGVAPSLYSLSPSRGRHFGVEFRSQFGQ